MADPDNAPRGLADPEVPRMTMIDYIVASANGISPLALPSARGLNLDFSGLDTLIYDDSVVALGYLTQGGQPVLSVFGLVEGVPHLLRVNLAGGRDVFDLRSNPEIEIQGVVSRQLAVKNDEQGTVYVSKIKPSDAARKIRGGSETLSPELVVTINPLEDTITKNDVEIHQRTVVSPTGTGSATGLDMPVLDATSLERKRGKGPGPEFDRLDDWSPLLSPVHNQPVMLTTATSKSPEAKALPFSPELFQQALEFVADAINDGVPDFIAEMDALSSSERAELMSYVAGDLRHVSQHLLTFPGYWLERSTMGAKYKIVEAIRLYISQQLYLDRTVKDVEDRNRRMEFTRAGMYSRITKRGNYMVDCTLASELRDDEQEYFPGFTYKQSISELLIEKSGLVDAVSTVFKRLGINITGEETIRRILNENLFLVQDKSAWQPLYTFWKNVLHGSIQTKKPKMKRGHVLRPSYNEGYGLPREEKSAYGAIKKILPMISMLVARNQFNTYTGGLPLTNEDLDAFFEWVNVSQISPEEVRLVEQTIMRNLEKGGVNAEMEELPREP